MIRTKAQQKKAQQAFDEKLRAIQAERVERLTRWRYRKLAGR